MAENTGKDDETTDPGRVPIEQRWAPISGHAPTGERPPAFRRRWLASLLCMVALIGLIALLS